MPTSVCPSVAQLEDLLAGRASPDAADSLHQHLLTCPLCEDLAAELRPSDTLLDGLRDASTLADPDPTEVARIQANVLRKSIPQQTAETTDGVPEPAWESLGFDLADDVSVLELLDEPDRPGEQRRLGKYRILRLLGRGGMGVVFEAEDRDLGRRVAVKLMRPAKRSPALVERFLREAQASARFRHPNLVTIYNVDQTKGSPYISMELLDGPDLEQQVKLHGPLAPREAIEAIRQAALGLAHAHAKGVIHRDVKPNNLMFDGKLVKVLDLGVARIVADDSTTPAMTQEKSVVGTPDYMAPEQLTDARSVDARSDIYSLGGTLHYLLTGRPPAQSVDLLHRVLSRSAAIDSVPAECPPSLAPTLRRMLELRPDERFRSMEEVVAALDAFLAEPALARERRGPWSQSWVAVGGSLVALLIALAMFFLLGPTTRVKTAAGWIVLQAPAGVLDEAEIVVDGERVRINTRDGEPIEVQGDVKTHKLRVSKAGFHTLTEEFEVTAGREKVLDVRLEPLAVATPPPATNATIPLVTPTPAPASAATAELPLKMKLRAWQPDRDSEPLPGIVPYPAALPGVKRWQMISHAPNGLLTAVAWSPDGRSIACCDESDSVRVYEAQTLALRSYSAGLRGSGGIALAWSADSQRLAYVTTSGTVRIYDAELKALVVWQCPEGRVDRLAWSPTGRGLLTSSDFPGSATVWDEHGAAQLTLKALNDRLFGAAFSPNGESIAAGSESGVIRIWNRTGGAIREFPADGQANRVLNWSPDGEWITAMRLEGEENDVRLWSPSGKPGVIVSAGTQDVAWRPDGKAFATCKKGEITIWKPSGEKETSFSGGFSNSPIAGLTFSPDGESLAYVKLRVLALARLNGELKAVAEGAYPDPYPDLAWSPDGKWLACTGSNVPGAVWSDEGEVKTRLPGRHARKLAWSRDGDNLAYSDRTAEGKGHDDSVRSWRPEDGAVGMWKDVGRMTSFGRTLDAGLLLGRMEGPLDVYSVGGRPGKSWLGHTFFPRSFAWSPNGDCLACGANDNLLRFWNRSGDLLASHSHVDEGWCSQFPLAWSHDGKTLASGRRTAIRFWNPDGSPQKDFAGRPDVDAHVVQVGWSLDDQRVSAALGNARVLGFRVADGKRSSTWSSRRNGEQIDAAAFHPDGLRLAVIDRQSVVTIHDLADGTVLWVGVNLFGGPIAVSPAGEILHGDPALCEAELRYVVERDDDRLEVLTPSQFSKRTQSPERKPGS